MQNKILILDFGSQYTQLIARKIRELNVYCEIYPYNNRPEITNEIKGVILSGSPFSVRDPEAPLPDLSDIKGKLPLLGICYGAQYLAHYYGGEVAPSEHREYGRAELNIINNSCKLFEGIKNNSQVWMSHADTIIKLPEDYKITASTNNIKTAAYKIENEETYGLQFHPEVYHSVYGKDILKNFVSGICGISQNWTPESFIETAINNLKKEIKNEKVILGLSGGVDSTVAAVLLNKAAGKNLYCIFINNGLLRKNEFTNVLKSYEGMGLNVKGTDAKELFYSALKGVTDPEKKRKIIGNTFIKVFDEEARKIKNVKFLAQGTIYPDVIESQSVKGPSATIKSHHNVGGLPDFMKLKVTEPLRLLFKDEVRKVGAELGIKKELLERHPFPGPGLGIRILGEVTPEKINILQEADDIFISELKKHELYNKVWQAATILLPVKSVGVMGDERTYENTAVLRAVNSVDGMTADWSQLPHEFLANVSSKITNKVKGINRVVYDISSKPPATVEWE
ncbi:MAG: glutamine-hydrolyzing GMP synthase [Chlorobi bacterium]|nr:glutamine-hydrolyzing GMP synthase [Chlorobiota bacterium]